MFVLKNFFLGPESLKNLKVDFLDGCGGSGGPWSVRDDLVDHRVSSGLTDQCGGYLIRRNLDSKFRKLRKATISHLGGNLE